MSTLPSSPLAAAPSYVHGQAAAAASHSATYALTSPASPLKRKAMSVTQTYYLAHTARGKLSSEAARPDHDLRLLVGHANLLDSLMLDLAQAEREQESWFNQSVKRATTTTTTNTTTPKHADSARHIQWADAIVEEPEEDWQAEDADSDSSDSESDDDFELESRRAPPISAAAPTVSPASPYLELDEEFEDDGAEDFASLGLHLTHSHANSPPELEHDASDESSDDEAMPPSPPADVLPSFSEKQRQEIATTGFYSRSKDASAPPAAVAGPSLLAADSQSLFDEGFYLPQRTSPNLVTAIRVY